MTEHILSTPQKPIMTEEVDTATNRFSDDRYNRIKDRFLVEIEGWEKRSPMLKKVTNQVRRVPPWLRIAFIVWWLLWKVIWLFVFIRIFLWSTFPASNRKQPTLSSADTTMDLSHGADAVNPTKVLYIVTSLAEYDNGHRSTVKGRDRFRELMVPCIVDSIQTMITHPYNFKVDLYLITAYTLKTERSEYLRSVLPHGVGLEIWEDACPLGYDKNAQTSKRVSANTRALARQHRYVIKDKFQFYDIFLPFEDDMRITGSHVRHFLDMTMELDQLTQDAPEHMSEVVAQSEDPKKMKFFGQMTRKQIQRLVPGFIRVEVLVNESRYGAQTKLAPIPLDFVQDGVEQHIDASICCHVPNLQPNVGIPPRPPASDVIIWETRPEAFSFRHLTGSNLFDWILLLPGPGKRLNASELVTGYWSGRDGAFGDMPKPSGGTPDLIAQQGGWMATQKQILRLNEELCMGSFLPPFDGPNYNMDGQQSMNVEFWSGGYQYFTGVRGGCNMQRVLSFKDFSKHLIYHMANNKQKQLPQDRMLRADNLFGQMNTVLKKAQAVMNSTVEHRK